MVVYGDAEEDDIVDLNEEDLGIEIEFANS
jgi:hypothetical protein